MPRRDRIADANQQVRELRNKLHAIDHEVVLPLRTRIAELERDSRVLTAKCHQLERMHDLYRKSWEAMLELFHAITTVAGGKS